jgi:hypothetical protein
MTIATIPSRTSSQTYTVTLTDDGAASCTCKAGQYRPLLLARPPGACGGRAPGRPGP